jgi:hypothetical protein
MGDIAFRLLEDHCRWCPPQRVKGSQRHSRPSPRSRNPGGAWVPPLVWQPPSQSVFLNIQEFGRSTSKPD